MVVLSVHKESTRLGVERCVVPSLMGVDVCYASTRSWELVCCVLAVILRVVTACLRLKKTYSFFPLSF